MAGLPRPLDKQMARIATHASMVQAKPQPVPEVTIDMRKPKETDGSKWFHFSETELEHAAYPFRFSVVLKFLQRKPTLDQIRLHLKARWGIKSFFSVSTMQRPCNVFICFATEEDFGIACTRESSDLDGSPYGLSIWSPDFDEDQESTLVPVWVFLHGLPPHFYHESMLRIITGAFGRFLKRDNFTACASRTDGARVCIEIDLSKPLVESFWLGVPYHPSSRQQEIIYEKVSSFCQWCKRQGHMETVCRKKKGIEGYNKSENTTIMPKKMWRRKEEKPELATNQIEQRAVQLNRNEEKRKRILQRELVIPSTVLMFASKDGKITMNFEEVRDPEVEDNAQPGMSDPVMSENCVNMPSRCNEQHSEGDYMDTGNYCEQTSGSGKNNRKLDIRNKLIHFGKNGISKDNAMEQAILRGDIDAIHETIVMNELDRIADVVIREDDPTDANQIENRMETFGQDMDHFLETDNMENEMGVGPHHTLFEGASGDELLEFEILNYETEYENFFPARKRRGNNRKKVVLGITTRSKKFY